MVCVVRSNSHSAIGAVSSKRSKRKRRVRFLPPTRTSIPNTSLTPSTWVSLLEEEASFPGRAYVKPTRSAAENRFSANTGDVGAEYLLTSDKFENRSLGDRFHVNLLGKPQKSLKSLSSRPDQHERSNSQRADHSTNLSRALT